VLPGRVKPASPGAADPGIGQEYFEFVFYFFRTKSFQGYFAAAAGSLNCSQMGYGPPSTFTTCTVTGHAVGGLNGFANRQIFDFRTVLNQLLRSALTSVGFDSI